MGLDIFLKEIGMTKKETYIYKTALFFGKTTASIVAKRLNRERTSTYKAMINMVKKGRFSHSKEHHTNFFETISITQLKQQFKNKLNEIKLIDNNIEEIEKEYNGLLGQHKHTTQISISEGIQGLRNVYLDIQNYLKETGFISIKCFSSATLESLSGGDLLIKETYTNFLKFLKNKNITVESFLGKGISIMEQLAVSINMSEIQNLPLQNNGTQMWIIGNILYFFIFKNEPYIINIKSQELTNLMHFVGDQLVRTSQKD